MSTALTNQKYLDGLKSNNLLLKLTWHEWLALQPPYQTVNFSIQDVTARYHRNGYDWDMHGSLFTPEKETDPQRAFVFFHGGTGSEKIMDLTPDGRPALARVVAARVQSPDAHLSRAITRREGFGRNQFPSGCRFTSLTKDSHQERLPTAI